MVKLETIISVINTALPLIQKGTQTVQQVTEAVTALKELGEEAKGAFVRHPDLAKLEQSLVGLAAVNDAAFARIDDKLTKAAERH